MKIKHLFPIFVLTASITTTSFPALAAQSEIQTRGSDICTYAIMPRYRYIGDLSVSVYPNSTRVKYTLAMSGNGLTSFSGTATIYKENSSGTYQQIDSESLDLSASYGEIRYTGYTDSDGSGKYKIVLSGTAYTNSGSEEISISNTSSY